MNVLRRYIECMEKALLKRLEIKKYIVSEMKSTVNQIDSRLTANQTSQKSEQEVVIIETIQTEIQFKKGPKSEPHQL